MRLHVRICIIPATSICTELRELRRSNVTNNKAGGRMWAFGYDLWKAKRGKWESSSYTSLLSRSCGEKFGHSSVLDSMLLRFWFSMSRNKKKKVFRGLSNPRMRCKDFSLCELLNVSIKKKNNTAEGKRDTHTSKRFRFHCIAQKKKLHTIHTKVTRLQDPCESAINTAISCSWNSKVRRLTQSCNRKGRKLRHYSNRGIARETFTSTGSRCRGL